MSTLQVIAVAAPSFGAGVAITALVAAVLLLRRESQLGQEYGAGALYTVDDAEEYVAELRATAELPAITIRHSPLALPAAPVPDGVEGWHIGGRWPVEPIEATPIFDEVAADLAARRRALRTPTQEMLAIFDRLTERWLCSHCEAGDCAQCPGCSCPCRAPALVGAGV